ncbi:MAG: LysR family transcriptional regulator [Myxococcota bacterium]
MQGTALEALNWDDVRLFLVLGRSRTLGEAALELGVDASTASRRLSALEETLGAQLFERGRGGIQPTESADALMPIAEEIEHAMARFSHQADAFEQEVSGSVRVTCPPDAAEALLIPLLPGLLARHPKLHIEVDGNAQLLDVARREADLALRIVRPTSGSLVVRRLFAVEWIVAARPDVAENLGTVRDWAKLPWIGWGSRYADAPACRWHQTYVGHAPALTSDNLRLQIAMVNAGLGVALIPSRSIAHYGLTPLKLSRRLKGDAKKWPTNEVYLVAHEALRRVPRVRAVWDYLVEQ